MSTETRARVRKLIVFGAIVMLVVSLIAPRNEIHRREGCDESSSGNERSHERSAVPAFPGGNQSGRKIIEEIAAEPEMAPRQDVSRRQQELRSRMLSLTADEMVPEILRYLDSGQDAPTGGGFIVGPGGFLIEAPSIRTLLLDMLGKLDPAEAASYSDKIFAQARSADEWALAMRNLGRQRNDSAAASLLLARFREMTGHRTWVKNPSGGFLEAFDIPVYYGSNDALHLIAGLASSQSSGPVKSAATLALERLILAVPGEAVRLNLNSELRPRMLSLIDPRVPEAGSAISAYLLDASVPEVEISQFCASFPRHAFSVSHNLLSEPTRHARSISDCARTDLAAAVLIEDILARMAPEAPHRLQVEHLKQRVGLRIESINAAIAEGSLDLDSP